MDKRERRSFVGAVQVREEDGVKIIEGHAAVFGQTVDIAGWFDEEIESGCFDRALKEKQDVRCLANHDPSRLLGRTKSGTLSLSIDKTGLKYEDQVPETTAGNDTVISIERGDMTGSSFGFIIRKQEWIYGKDGDKDKRIIKDVDLFDVSPVTFPAYDETDVAVRAHQEWRAQMESEQRGEGEQAPGEEGAKDSVKRKARAREARVRTGELKS